MQNGGFNMAGGQANQYSGGAPTEVNELLQLNQCSPLMVYLCILAGYGILLYTTKNDVDRLSSMNADLLFTMDMNYEIMFILMIGVLIYSTCTAKDQTMSWIILMIPVAVLGCKIMYLFTKIPDTIQSSELSYGGGYHTNVRSEPKQMRMLQVPDEEDTYESRIREQVLSQNSEPSMSPPLVQKQASSITSLGFGDGSGSPNESFARF
jgi:hypothetical protein